MDKKALGPRGVCYPEPVFLVGADVDGRPNFMAVAWGSICNDSPRMLAVAIRRSRHTLKGIRQNGTFSANVPSLDMVNETDYCGIISGADTDKNAACGFDVFYGRLGNAPLIAQCPVNIECEVRNTLELGSHDLVVGEIAETHVSAECLSDGKPDIAKIKPFIYSSHPFSSYFELGLFTARAFDCGKTIKNR